ncbi:hypothetical protein LX32DRAFT_653600 [Colletotrichum zoysiae]|uniref:Uncharacterized protein n=1 Tax=Colletotrichum zoysiae TaxID=1216348 RepID=A0AAD9HHB2_9PEZI|nr:hypothetical protein LX32DRAFT_653600 [Colletotrichum zoysiae]
MTYDEMVHTQRVDEIRPDDPKKAEKARARFERRMNDRMEATITLKQEEDDEFIAPSRSNLPGWMDNLASVPNTPAAFQSDDSDSEISDSDPRPRRRRHTNSFHSHIRLSNCGREITAPPPYTEMDPINPARDDNDGQETIPTPPGPNDPPSSSNATNSTIEDRGVHKGEESSTLPGSEDASVARDGKTDVDMLDHEDSPVVPESEDTPAASGSNADSNKDDDGLKTHPLSLLCLDPRTPLWFLTATLMLMMPLTTSLLALSAKSTMKT